MCPSPPGQVPIEWDDYAGMAAWVNVCGRLRERHSTGSSTRFRHYAPNLDFARVSGFLNPRVSGCGFVLD